MIRIVLVVQNLEMGGMERMVIKLANRLNRSRFHVSILCLMDSGPLDLSGELNEDVGVQYLGKKDGFKPLLFFKVAGALKKLNADIVHTHSSTANFYGAIGARIAGIKSIINTDHGGIYFETNRKKWISKHLLKLNHKMIAVSANLRKDLIKMGHRQRKVVVIPNGIDFNVYQQEISKELVRGSLDLNMRDFVIINIGRIEEVKNQKFLIDSARVLADQIAHLKILIVGEGALKEPLERYAASQGIEDKIMFLGYRQEIADVLKASDCLVNCSKSESFGLTIIEAMASGVPVVATDVGGVKEIVAHEQTGFLIPLNHQTGLGESVMKIYHHDAVVLEMVNTAREMVREQYSIDAMVHQYEELYESTVSH